jgi:hypothetical protein
MYLRPRMWSNKAEGCEVGPYVTFGRDMAQAMPNDSIALIVVCAAPSRLASDWLPPSSGGPGREYSLGLVDGVKRALAALGPDFQPEVVGFCWMQGESDGPDGRAASQYQTNLANLVNDLRKEYAAARLPFVIAQIDRFPQWGQYDVIRWAQAAVAKSLRVPNAEIYAIDVSFAGLKDEAEQAYLNRQPTSFVLPAEAVDRLRRAAGTIIADSPEFQRLLKDAGAKVVDEAPRAGAPPGR